MIASPLLPPLALSPAPTPSLAWRRARLVLLPFGTAVASALAGFGIGYLLVGDGLRSTNGWDALGAAVIMAVLGGAATIVGYVVASIVAVVHFQPAGARSGPIAVLLGAPIVWIVMFSLVARMTTPGPVTDAGLTLLGLGMLALLLVLTWVTGRLAPDRWLLGPALVTGAALLLVLSGR